MSLAKLVCAALLALAWPAALFAGDISDDDIRVAMIGSWVNPPQQSSQITIPARQVFRDNGTTTLYIYSSLDCREPMAYFEGNWTVRDGMLITQITRSTHPNLVPVGTVEQVTVLAVDLNHLLLEADDEVYERDKSETCHAAGSRRT